MGFILKKLNKFLLKFVFCYFLFSFKTFDINNSIKEIWKASAKAPKADPPDKKASVVDSLPQKNDGGISDNEKNMMADNGQKKTEKMLVQKSQNIS